MRGRRCGHALLLSEFQRSLWGFERYRTPQAAPILTAVKINPIVVLAAIEFCLVTFPGIFLFVFRFGGVSVFVCLLVCLR